MGGVELGTYLDVFEIVFEIWSSSYEIKHMGFLYRLRD